MPPGIPPPAGAADFGSGLSAITHSVFIKWIYIYLDKQQVYRVYTVVQFAFTAPVSV